MLVPACIAPLLENVPRFSAADLSAVSAWPALTRRSSSRYRSRIQSVSQPAEMVSLEPRMPVPTSLMLGRNPCPSPAAKSNSITNARNDEMTKSIQSCLFPRPAMLWDRSPGSANATPALLWSFSGFRRFGVSCPVFRLRGYYQSRPRFRPAFRTGASRDRTEGKITKGRICSRTGRRALFSGPGDHNEDG